MAQKTIEIAHSENIPVLVDAAGQIYPLDLFGKYVKMGADFQCIAAKYLGATQSTGLALGSEEMIRKISKQEISNSAIRSNHSVLHYASQKELP